LAPSRANALAVARPMPLFPPVTTATLFLNLSLMVCSSWWPPWPDVRYFKRRANTALGDDPPWNTLSGLRFPRDAPECPAGETAA